MKTPFLLLACAAMLTACGGGSTDSSATQTIDPIDRYIGTWTKKCDTWPEEAITDLNGRGVSTLETIKLEKVSATSATYRSTLRVYSDSRCTTSPIATLVSTGLNDNSQALSADAATLTTGLGLNQLTYIGTQALQNETVDRMVLSGAKYLQDAGSVGSAVIPAGSWLLQPEGSSEGLFKFRSASQILFNAIENGVIPSAMVDDDYRVLTKQ